MDRDQAAETFSNNDNFLIPEPNDPSSEAGETEPNDPTSEEVGTKSHANLNLYKQYVENEAFMNSHQLLDLLRICQLNWFAFVDELRTKLKDQGDHVVDQVLLDFGGQLPYFGLNEKEEKQIEHSRQAYLMKRRLEEMEEGNEITSGSEVERNGEEEEVEAAVTSCKTVMEKEVRLMRRRMKRKAARKVAEMRLLGKKKGKHVSKILQDCPDIGQSIEEFIQDNHVGADAWRRTGVLTVGGNRKCNKKVTFTRIKKHLEEKYHRKFGYGTVVQLCVPRNKRHKSAANYKGLAKVTSRRARKGFTIRYNPDTHWSATFYKGLDKLQYTDGRDIMNLNRDDQAGFRLDTLATHSKHAVLCTSQILTTKTNYVKKHPSTLQTTSHNFTGTKNTGEMCAGVVKAIPIHAKNPAQHAKDIEDIESQDFQPVFRNSETLLRKSVECIRVDGGNDEGPSHEEVQFFWTMRHMEKRSKALLITTRESGSSNKNRVELQNGCLALAHSNLFIPSTLNGPVLSESGKIDDTRLKQNLDSAIDIYISRVDQAPCGDACIQLFKGTDNSVYQNLRPHLKTFQDLHLLTCPCLCQILICKCFHSMQNVCAYFKVIYCKSKK